MGAHTRILPPHRRVAIEGEIAMHLDRVELLIARLDRADGDTDAEPDDFDEDDDPAGGDNAEDDFDLRARVDGPGCPLADPGGCEHDGREPEDAF